MSGKRMKRIRAEVYGDMAFNSISRRYKRLVNGQIIADPLRNEYQTKKGRRAS